MVVRPGRRPVVVALLLLMTGCLARLPARGEPRAETFDPMRFFAGRTHGEGVLDMRIGDDRTVRVEGAGRMREDGSFQLDQTVTYGDGKEERRVWLLRRVDATRYAATLSDAKGEVRAESAGGVFHLRYLLRHPAVYMEQWLVLQPDGRSVKNLAQVTVLGVPWARLSETITREPAPPAH